MTEERLLLRGILDQGGKIVDKWEHYIAAYEAELAPFLDRGLPCRMLEVGVQNGGSLEVWQKYLPAGSQIRGLDIDPRVGQLAFASDAIRADVVDATDAEALNACLSSERFDIIIDDGSHRSADVNRTFDLLFDRLEKGGKYFIEDLHCSYYRSHDGGLKDPHSSIERLKSLIDDLHADYVDRSAMDAERFAGMMRFGSAIARLSFYDSIAVVEKLQEEKQRPYRRVLAGDDAAVQPAAAWVPRAPVCSLRPLILTDPAARAIEAELLAEVERHRDRVTDLENQVALLTAQIVNLRDRPVESPSD